MELGRLFEVREAIQLGESSRGPCSRTLVQNARRSAERRRSGDARVVGNRSTLIRFAIVRGARAAFSLASRATNWEEEAYRYRRRRRRLRRRCRRRHDDIIELLAVLPIAPVPVQLAVPVSGPGAFPRSFARRQARI